MPDIHLEERIAGLEGSYREITKRIDDLRSEMHRGFDGVRAEINGVRAEMSGKAEVNGLRTEVNGLRAEVNGFRVRLDGLGDDVKGLRNELRGEMSSNFRWTMSLILINWLSLLAGIFLFALKK